jgi:hypothetical protein
MTGLVSLLDGARALEQVLVHSPFDTWATLKTLLRLLAVGALDAAAQESERRGGLRLKVGLPIELRGDRVKSRAQAPGPAEHKADRFTRLQ